MAWTDVSSLNTDGPLKCKVYGLVGKSGTGKSHHAATVASEVGTSCLIDDGLLVSGGRAVAGYSAKFEASPLAAVRRALFADGVHRSEVYRGLCTLAPEAVVILGTSRHMVEVICSRLALPATEIEWINVAQVVEASAINTAVKLRSEGRHAIPINQPALDRPARVSQLFQAVLQRIRVSPVSATVMEASPIVVRPMFASGSIHIHSRAVRQCVVYFIKAGQYPFQVKHFYFDSEGISHFRISVRAQWQQNLYANALRLHREVCNFLQESLGFPYPQVDVLIESIEAPSGSDAFPRSSGFQATDGHSLTSVLD